MAIRMRIGKEADFDAEKMLPGEWAVSTDARIVRMCFAPGIVIRMATYEAFENDMEEIRSILEEAKTVQQAVEMIQQNVSATEIIVEEYAIMSKSYAVGGTNSRENEDYDNAKYYYDQAKRIAQGLNGIVPMGTITFEELPTEDIVVNAMYNISNAFTSDERFNDGGGLYYGPGNNVLWTATGKWDVTASSSVTGVKGNEESTYRQGNVNITKENIGLGDDFFSRLFEQKGFLSNADVVDNLLSTASNLPLSAKQGNVLMNLFGGKLSNQMTTLDVGYDMNGITEIGFYTGSSLANAPVDGWVVFIHMRVNNDPNYCVQILVSNGYTKMFFRLQNGGNWENWYELSRTMDLANYLPLTGGTVGKLNTDSDIYVPLDSSAFLNAPITANADLGYSSYLRAGYGFHNYGVNGAFLYLDTDGRFKYISNDGHTKRILSDVDFTVSGDDLILNWL